MGKKLDRGDIFPEIELSGLDSGSLVLPRDIDTPYAFVLFYRGHW